MNAKVTATEKQAVVSLPEVSDAEQLRVGGLVRFTATDYPGELSGVVFCQGCPWRCAYCHNPHLIPARGEEQIAWETISVWLKARKGLLDAIVFSGGEPTMQTALLGAIKKTKRMGFKIGLHTGGAYPRKLQNLLPYLNWVGLDIKADMKHYEAVTGISGSEQPAFESLKLIQQSGVPYEVRTTVHGALTPPKQLLLLAQQLHDAGVTHWVLQPFRDMGCDNGTLLARAEEAVVLDEALLEQFRQVIQNVEVRG